MLSAIEVFVLAFRGDPDRQKSGSLRAIDEHFDVELAANRESGHVVRKDGSVGANELTEDEHVLKKYQTCLNGE